MRDDVARTVKIAEEELDQAARRSESNTNRGDVGCCCVDVMGTTICREGVEEDFCRSRPGFKSWRPGPC